MRLELHTPMQDADDAVRGMLAAIGADGPCEQGERRLDGGEGTRTGHPVLKIQENSGEKGDMEASLADEGGGDEVRRVIAEGVASHGHNAGTGKDAEGGLQTLVTLVVGVVVGQCGMGNASLAQQGSHAGVATEYITLAQRGGHGSERTFKIGHRGIGTAQDRSHIGKQPVGRMGGHGNAYTSVEQQVACKEHHQ